MADDNTNKKNPNEVVTAIGNAWVVCRSKSYPGRVYYFNTLRRQAVWNLSETEIEKAKISTQGLCNQIVQLDNCPEPKEPPMDHLDNSNKINQVDSRQSNIYNREIRNNRYANQPFPYGAFVTPQCSHIVAAPVGVNIATPSNSYNSNVWAMPPGQPIFISPAVPLEQNLNQNMTVLSTSVPVQCFRSNNEANRNSPSKFDYESHVNPRNNCHSRFNNERDRFQNRFFNRNKCNDLREVLSAPNSRRFQRQRAEGLNNTNSLLEEHEQTSYSLKNPVNEAIAEYKCQTDVVSQVENVVQMPATTVKVDLTSLREFAKPYTDPDIWYIAVDSTVMLDHLNFINILLNSDDQCQLLVPQDVVAELRAIASENSNNLPRVKSRATRAVAFLNKQLEDGCAIIGENTFEPLNTSNPNILNCCLELQEKNYHVIILSNNTDLQKRNLTKNIKFFTISELKSLLIKQSTQTTLKSPLPQTIPRANALKTQNEKSNRADEVTRRNNDVYKTTENVVPRLCDNKTNLSQMNTITSKTKSTMDVEVQTDSDIEIKLKKREIKLKRGTSIDPTTTTDSPVEKVQYKWRRKRIGPNVEKNETTNATNSIEEKNNDCITLNGMNVETELIIDNKINTESEKQHLTRQPSCDSINKYRYSDEKNKNDSETSSSDFLQRNRTLNKVVVEETSMSEIISNTTSNMGSETEYTNQYSRVYIENEETPVNNTMFEINGKSMEEYLAMRCDEWVSRFVQIMEEALTQVLGKCPPFSHPSMPSPPWCLHEAIDCIPIKFPKCKNLNEVADKFCSHLYKVSDNKGKMNVNMKPSEFMEMYSYGVQLIEALQVQLIDCDDLQAASEYLSKLLKDIQTPILDSHHTDTFGDIQEPVENELQVPDIVNEVNRTENSSCSFTTSKKSGIDHLTEDSCSVRSNKQKIEEQTMDKKQVKFVRNIDLEDSFLESLHLQRKITNLNNKNMPHSNEFAPVKLKENSSSPNSRSFQTSTSVRSGFVEDKNNTGTVFVRNFSKCTEYEQKCENRIREPLDLDKLDYSANFDDRYDEECSDEICSIEDGYKDSADCEDTHSDFVSLITQEGQNICKKSNPEVEVIRNGCVDSFFKAFMDEIKVTFLRIHSFCEKARDNLINDFDNCKRVEMHGKAEEAYLEIDNILKSLQSILFIETFDIDNSSQYVLRKAGFDLYENKFRAYRDTIRKCTDQANILLESIGIIRNAMET